MMGLFLGYEHFLVFIMLALNNLDYLISVRYVEWETLVFWIKVKAKSYIFLPS